MSKLAEKVAARFLEARKSTPEVLHDAASLTSTAFATMNDGLTKVEAARKMYWKAKSLLALLSIDEGDQYSGLSEAAEAMFSHLSVVNDVVENELKYERQTDQLAKMLAEAARSSRAAA
jgi:hypothetical protein